MKTRYTFVFLFSIFFTAFAFAQQVFPVNLSGALVPPHSLLLSDYAESRSQDLMFTALFNDPIETSRDVIFRVTVKNNGREILQTDPNFTGIPITLEQFNPTLLTGVDLAPWLDVVSMQSIGGGRASNALPEGFNQICLEVIDLQRRVPISRQVCVGGFFQLLEPPLFDLPACGSELAIQPTQNLMFRWLPRHIGLPNAPALVEYEFTLVELLPGIMDPNDGFEQAIQIYQTTTTTPTLLYMEGEPQLEPNKTYAWRVQARDPMGSEVFENKGFSPVCTFSMRHNRSTQLASGCEANITDFGPVVNNDLTSGLLSEGDIVKLGFFDLEVTQIDGAGNGYSGKGTVAVPFLKANVKVIFQNLKIDNSGQVYEVESAKALYDVPIALPATDLTEDRLAQAVTPAFLTSMNDLFAEQSMQKYRTSNRLESDKAPIGLPFNMDESSATPFGSTAPQVFVLGMEFTEREGKLVAVAAQRNNYNGETSTFAGSAIGFTPTGISQRDALPMLNDFEIALDNGDVLRLFKTTDTRTGTRLKLNCEGFGGYQLKGQYILSKTKIVDAENPQQNIIVDFETEASSLTNFIASTQPIVPFQLPNTPDYVFQTGEGTLDFSTLQNISGFTDSLAAAQGNAWTGIYFNQGSVKLPTAWNFAGTTLPGNLTQGNIIIDPQGVRSVLGDQDIVSITEGHIRDWGFSIDEMQLFTHKSEIDSASLNGQIKIPILDQAFPYQGSLDLQNNKTQDIVLKPRNEQNGMSLWKGDIQLGNNTEVKVINRSINGQSTFIPAADLDGDLSINISADEFKEALEGDKKVRLERLQKALGLNSTEGIDLQMSNVTIKSLSVDPLATKDKRYVINQFDEDAKIKIADQEFPLNSMMILNQEDKGTEELGLQLAIKNGENIIGITIWAKASGTGAYTFDRIDVDSRIVDCDCTSQIYKPTPNGLESLPSGHGHTTGAGPDGLFASNMEDVDFADFPVNGSQLTIPFLQDLQINISNTGAKITAQTKSIGNQDVGQLSLDKPSAIAVPGLALNGFKATQEFYDALTTHTNSFDGNLPYDLTPKVKEFLGKYNEAEHKFPDNAKLILASFEVGQADVSAKAKILLVVDHGNGQFLTFGAGEVKLKPQAVGFDKLYLYLLEEVVNNDTRFPFTFKKNFSEEPDKGSYAYVECIGFKHYNIQADYVADFGVKTGASGCFDSYEPNTKLLQIRPTADINADQDKLKNGTSSCRAMLFEQLSIPFTVNGKNLKSFMAPIQTTGDRMPFMVKDFEVVMFRINEGVVDYSASENSWSEKPTNLVVGNEFVGLHFKSLTMSMVGIMQGSTANHNRKPLEIPIENFAFSHGQGMFGSIDKQDVVKDGGDVGGWDLKIDRLKFGLKDNVVTTAFNPDVLNGQVWENNSPTGAVAIQGRLRLPIVEEEDKNYMKFDMALTYSIGAKAPVAFMVISEAEQGKGFELEPFNVKMFLCTNVDTPAAQITMNLGTENQANYFFTSEFEPFADMNGYFEVNYKADEPDPKTGFAKSDHFKPDFYIPRLTFEGFKINDPSLSSDCSAESAGIKGIKNLNFGGFGFNVNPTSVSCNINQTGALFSGLSQASNTDTKKEDNDKKDNDKETGLQGLPISLSDVQFNCVKFSDGAVGYKLDFEISVDFIGTVDAAKANKKFVQSKLKEEDDKPKGRQRSGAVTKDDSRHPNNAGAKSTELTAAGQLAIYAKVTPEKKLKFDRVGIDALRVDADYKFLHIEGGFVLYNGDKVYGDGFKGYLSASFGKGAGLDFKVLMQTGKTKYSDAISGDIDKAYRYFFIDGQFILKKGIPVDPVFQTLYWHGAGGGFHYNMNPADNFPDDKSYAAFMVSQGQKNVGEPNYNSAVLSEGNDPDGVMKPGFSLSGTEYKPRKDALGFTAKVVASINNGGHITWGDMEMGMTFTTDKFGIQSINANASLYALVIGKNGEPGEVGDTDGAAGKGKATAQLNIEKGFASVVADFTFSYPPPFITGGTFALNADGNGYFLFLFKDAVEGVGLPLTKAGEWQMKMGTPLKPGLNMNIEAGGLTLAKMGAYFQTGHQLDPMPRISELIPEWTSNDAMKAREGSKKINWAQGDGLAFGAKFDIPDNIYEFLMFRARIVARAGFDISLLNYDKDFVKQLGCGNESGDFGISNWYARGQAYGYLKGAMDMHINLGFIDKWVNLISIDAAALLQAELPNPTWMRAAIKAKASVLDGLIDVNVRFKAEIGKRCDGLVGNPVASIPLIESTAPASNAKDVPIYQNPTVSFNFPEGKLIVLEDYDGGIDPRQRTFRPHLKSMKLYKVDGGRTLVKEGFIIAKDKYSATLPLDVLLEPHTNYELEVEASWQENINGQWGDFIYQGKPYVEKTNPDPLKFTTGGRPHAIASDMLEYQAPAYDQRYWHKDYALPQLLFSQSGYEYMFPDNTTQLKAELEKDQKSTDGLPTGIPLEYIIELTEYSPTDGSEIRRIEFEIGEHPGKTASVERPVIAYKTPSEYANLSYQLPYVKTTTVSGRSVEFRKLNEQVLKKGHLYQLELVRKPVQAFVGTQTERVTSVSFDKSETVASSEAGELDEKDVGATVTKRVTTLKSPTASPGAAEMNKVLYSYQFGVSQYDHLWQKLEAMQVQPIAEADAEAKEKYDHPGSRKEQFPVLKLGRKFKDHYFAFSGAREGIDQADEIKILKNLITRQPDIPTPLTQSRGFMGIPIYSLAPPPMAGQHPWEKNVYVDRKGYAAYNTIHVNRDEKKDAAFNDLSGGIKAEDILSDTEIKETNKDDSHYVFHADGIDKNSFSGEKVISTDINFNQIRHSLYQTSWKCNEKYNNDSWSAQKGLSESGWTEFVTNIMTPYYGVEDWAFHLRFNGDDRQKTLTAAEKTAKKLNNQTPSGTINGLLGTQSAHFAFEDGRERILQNQYFLAKAIASNLVFVSYLSYIDRCKPQGDFQLMRYFYYLDGVDAYIKTADFDGRTVDIAYPKMMKWQKFDEVVPNDQRQIVGEQLWKLPLEAKAGSPVTTTPVNVPPAARIYTIKTDPKVPDGLYLFYPDAAGDNLTKLAVYDDDKNKLLYFWDAKIDEDHVYTHEADGTIRMEVDYSPAVKQSGIEIFKGKGKYHIVANFSSGQQDLYAAKIDMSQGGTQEYQLKLVKLGTPEGTEAFWRLHDYPWVRLTYNDSNNEITVYRGMDLPQLKGDGTYNFEWLGGADQRYPLKLLKGKFYSNEVQFASISEDQQTEFDYDWANSNGWVQTDARTRDEELKFPATLKSSTFKPGNRTDLNVLFQSNQPNTGSSDQASVNIATLNDDFYKRGKATILLRPATSYIPKDDCLLADLPWPKSNANGAIDLGLPSPKNPYIVAVDENAKIPVNNQYFTIDFAFQANQHFIDNQNNQGVATMVDFSPVNIVATGTKISVGYPGGSLEGEVGKLEKDKWYRITISFSSQRLDLFFNNSKITSRVLPNTTFQNAGFYLTEIAGKHNGALDFFTVWNKPVSCTPWHPSYGRNEWKNSKDLALYYEFDNHYGKEKPGNNRITDLSGNNYDAMVKGVNVSCEKDLWVKVSSSAFRDLPTATRPKESFVAVDRDASTNELYLNLLECDVKYASAQNDKGQVIWYYDSKLGEVHEYTYQPDQLTIRKAPPEFAAGLIKIPAKGVHKVLSATNLGRYYVGGPTTYIYDIYRTYIVENLSAGQKIQNQAKPNAPFYDNELVQIVYDPVQQKWNIRDLSYNAVYNKTTDLNYKTSSKKLKQGGSNNKLKEIVFVDSQTKQNLALFRINGLYLGSTLIKKRWGDAERIGDWFDLPIEPTKPIEVYVKFETTQRNSGGRLDSYTEHMIKLNAPNATNRKQTVWLTPANAETVDPCIFVNYSEELALQLAGSTENYLQSKVNWGGASTNEFSYSVAFSPKSLAREATLLDGPVRIALNASELVINSTRIKHDIKADQWYNLIVTYDGQKLDVLLNNNPMHSETISINLDKTQDFVVGKNFEGLLGLIFFWEKGMSRCELFDQFTNLKQAGDKLLLFLDYRNRQGTQINDQSGKNNHATLHTSTSYCNYVNAPYNMSSSLSRGLGGCTTLCKDVYSVPTIIHKGGDCDGFLFIAYPEGKGELKTVTIYNSQGQNVIFAADIPNASNERRRRPYVTKFEYHEYKKLVPAGTRKLRSGQWAVNYDDRDKFPLGNYTFYIQLGDAFYEASLTLKQEQQELPLTPLNARPAMLDPFPLISSRFRAYAGGGGDVKFRTLGKALGKNTILNYCNEQKCLRLTNFTSTGFTYYNSNNAGRTYEPNAMQGTWDESIYFSSAIGTKVTVKTEDGKIYLFDIDYGYQDCLLHEGAESNKVSQFEFAPVGATGEVTGNYAIELDDGEQIAVPALDLKYYQEYVLGAKVWLKNNARVDLFDFGTGKLSFANGRISFYGRQTAPLNIKYDSWTHIALQLSRDSYGVFFRPIHLYVNGNKVHSFEFGLSFNAFSIGGSPSYWDYVYLLNAKLNEAEIKKQATQDIEPSKTAYASMSNAYPFYYDFNQIPAREILNLKLEYANRGSLKTSKSYTADELKQKWKLTSDLTATSTGSSNTDTGNSSGDQGSGNSSNKVLDTNGSSGFLDCGAVTLNNANGFTIEAWVKADEFGNINTVAGIEEGLQTALLRVLKLGNDNQTYDPANGKPKPQLVVINAASHAYSISYPTGNSSSLQPNKWYHLAGVAKDSEVILYVNGQEINRQSTVLAPTISGTFQVGKSMEGRWWNGQIEDVKVWKTALSAQQISQEVSGTAVPGPDLIMHYNFDESAGKNAASSEHQATLQGGYTTKEVPKSEIKSGNEGQSNGNSSGDQSNGNSSGDQSNGNSSGDQGTGNLPNKVLDTDGSSGFLDCGAVTLNTSNGFTIEAWVKADEFGNINTVAGMEGSQTALLRVLKLGNDNQTYDPANGKPKPQLVVTSSRGPQYSISYPTGNSSSLQPNKWYHLAGVAKSTELILYVNGQEVNRQSMGLATTIFGTFQVAKSMEGRWWDGQIEDVKVWKTALSAQQISQEVSGTAVPGPDLIMHYNFDESAGKNAASSEHQATLQGGYTTKEVPKSEIKTN